MPEHFFDPTNQDSEFSLFQSYQDAVVKIDGFDNVLKFLRHK